MLPVKLHTAYKCRYGAPTITHVHPEIFRYMYFGNCMDCATCDDSCCQFGVDVDVENVLRISKALNMVPSMMFDALIIDPEFPGGAYRRTQRLNGACIFRRDARGCLLHTWCIEHDLDYHELKPMVSCLFPLTFDDGLLHAANEVCDSSLYCLCSKISLYRGIRDELAYYFDGLVDELDSLEPR